MDCFLGELDRSHERFLQNHEVYVTNRKHGAEFAAPTIYVPQFAAVTITEVPGYVMV